MKNIVGIALLAVALGGCAGSPANMATDGAMAVASIERDAAPRRPDGFVPIATAIPDTSIAAGIPSGWVGFCLRNSDQCELPAHSSATIALTEAGWDLLGKVNRTVNAAIKPLDDAQHYGVADYWVIPTDGYGDCEDYALTKRKALMDAGLPVAALRMAVVLTDTKERHAILTVATDRGDFVLDNLSDEVRPWTGFSYVWLERQDPRKRWGWDRLFADNSGAAPTAALAMK